MTFEQLNLIPALMNAIGEQGYTTPSPIQEQAIPPLLEGKDLIGCAQTGSGKTAAFALPILQNLAEKPGKGIRALILTPTRELALQIYDNFKAYGVHLWLKSTVVYGGVRQGAQVRALQKGVEILVATPGRLTDLMNQGFVDLSHVETFVLDEADRMLDMGFIHDIKKVQKLLPEERQTLLFSATMPPEIEQLAQAMLHDPVILKIDPVTTPATAVSQSIYYVDKDNKPALLRKIIKDPAMKNALVFTRTKHGADRVVRDLAAGGIHAVSIHGNKGQSARQEALYRFKSGMVNILVATDIAARGIDVPHLSHVINYNVPEEAESYIHRIGRTGRAGAGGSAITLCCYDELEHLRAVERIIGKKLDEQPCDYPMVVLQKSEKAPRPVRKPRPVALPGAKAAKPAAGTKEKKPTAVQEPKKAAPRPEGVKHSDKAPGQKNPFQKSAKPGRAFGKGGYSKSRNKNGGSKSRGR